MFDHASQCHIGIPALLSCTFPAVWNVSGQVRKSQSKKALLREAATEGLTGEVKETAAGLRPAMLPSWTEASAGDYPYHRLYCGNFTAMSSSL